jgi:uncharacterized protein
VGEGRAIGTPDRCLVNAALNVMADSLANAVSQVSVLSSQVLDVLRAEGVESGDIRTTNLAVQDYLDPHERRVTARVGSYQLEITVRDISDVGRLLGTMTKTAGDSFQVRGLQLTVSDPSDLRRTARAEAVSDAKAKAQQLADAASVPLGQVLSIEEIPPTSGASLPRASAPGGGGEVIVPPVVLEPGNVAIISRVTMTFGIGE